MTVTSRRTVLGLIAAASAGVPLGSIADVTPGRARAATDTYGSNTKLYADQGLREGTDYWRRHLRQELPEKARDVRWTTIMAPHGGNIEFGTSELAVAIAGYSAADMTPTGGPRYDYWMFEGVRSKNNGVLHVTATHCDDPVALSLASASQNVLAVHGCSPQTDMEADTKAVLVGGRSTALKEYLTGTLTAAGFTCVDAAARYPALDGMDPDNITNRTALGEGAQLEITSPLREAMFEVNTRKERKTSTTGVFTNFVAAVRDALALLEAAQRAAG